jgi:hypothetical protein
VCAALFTVAGILSLTLLTQASRSEMHYLNRRPASSERTQPKTSPSRIPTRKVSSWVAPRGCLPDRNGESLFSNEKLHAQHAPSAHTGQGLLLELPFRPAAWLMNAPWPLTLDLQTRIMQLLFVLYTSAMQTQSSSARQLNSIARLIGRKLISRLGAGDDGKRLLTFLSCRLILRSQSRKACFPMLQCSRKLPLIVVKLFVAERPCGGGRGR